MDIVDLYKHISVMHCMYYSIYVISILWRNLSMYALCEFPIRRMNNSPVYDVIYMQ